MSADVIVVGAGIIGSSIAYHLARAGASTLLVDRSAPAAAPGATWASAGGLRSQGRYGPERPISLAASIRWQTLSQELDANLEVALGGHLHVAESEAEFPIIEERVAADRSAGIAIESLKADELRKIVPGIAPSALMGAYTPGDGQAHPGRTARAFAAAAVRHGARAIYDSHALPLCEGGRVTGILTASGEKLSGGTVVLATGAWSIALLKDLGIDLPIRWRGLQMLLSEIAPAMLAPTVTAVGRNLSLKQSPSGQLMVGGRWFARPQAPEPHAEPIDAHVARQWSSAVGILPAMAHLRLAQSWAGAEAQSLDGSPFIGPSGLPGLYLATGFSNHGFQISPEIGRLVASDLLSGPEPLLKAFRPDRPLSAERAAAFKAETILL
ncbi:NAD(P)/FAD-dependent oxidoreductase [Microvirga zambiensis]|uniref:NAD(P)/FAD-dependent oxidoreductase n=1 Tax=Microvirga zambiensis TaxID=1402137 RepID=UPI00191E76B0|nr:FAD-dependent oxidoreductase [Microvirga zambiensis]